MTAQDFRTAVDAMIQAKDEADTAVQAVAAAQALRDQKAQALAAAGAALQAAIASYLGS